MESIHLSSDQLNFTRLAKVCLELMKIMLKDILKTQIKPEDLYHAISSCPELTNGQHKLRPELLRFCFVSPPDVPTYNKFDVSLLLRLIHNLCPTIKPANGWSKPSFPTDIEVGDDIVRLKLFRNELYEHQESAIVTDTKFKSQWKELQYVTQRIHAFVTSQEFPAEYEIQLATIGESDFDLDDMEKYRIHLAGMMNLIGKTENEGK